MDPQTRTPAELAEEERRFIEACRRQEAALLAERRAERRAASPLALVPPLPLAEEAHLLGLMLEGRADAGPADGHRAPVAPRRPGGLARLRGGGRRVA